MNAARALSGHDRDVANRGPITVSVMLATIMISLDTTIANVALPHIQGSVSASADQITWVLTSYIVAATIMTPLTGFMTERLGRKMVLNVCIVGFTVASMLCGIANSLAEIVIFRLLQGLFGAALIPLSQAVLLDINPPERHGQAMAVWGAGAVLGPILGPALGGWLTDNLDWRWVFFINLPVGVLAFCGVFFFLSEKKGTEKKRFDVLGFASLAIAIGAFQLLLDRGPGQDWLGSAEIWTYLIVCGIALWIFGVQLATAEKPFVSRGLLADANFMTCCFFGFFIGILLYSTLALLPPMMQTLLGYPVAFTGLVSMPRGLGSFIAMFAVGQLVGRMNIKLILAIGMAISIVSLWQMSHFSLGMDTHLIIISGFLSGAGTGLIFVPLSTIAFATVKPELRAEGAGLFTLVRNIGSAAGISIMQALFVSGIEKHHAVLVEHARPDNPLYQAYAQSVFLTHSAMAAFNGVINRQASMLAYLDDFRLMLVITVACSPLILLMRTPKAKGARPFMSPTTKTRLATLVGAISLAALASACTTVGPNFQAPEAPKTAGYLAKDEAAPAAAATLDQTGLDKTGVGPWWTALGSPELDAVIRQALADNPTLVEADATLAQAGAALAAVRGQAGPQVSANAGVNRERANLQSFGFTSFGDITLSNPTFSLYSVGAGVGYDLDLWGGQKRRIEGAAARAEAQGRRAEAAYLSLTANIALQAATIATLQAQIANVERMIADDEANIALVRRADALGGATRLAGVSAQAQLEQDRAELPPLQGELAAARHALALLVGKAPADWTPPAFTLDTLKLSAPVPMVLPSTLVRKRPDILAAEAELHAATADIGVATADLYPNLKLSASLTQGALKPKDLFSYDASGWDVGAGLTAPLFDGGTLKARREQARAAAKVASARYQQTVLTAFGQVADALAALAADEAGLAAQGRVEAQASERLRLARLSVDRGGGTMLEVIDAQRALNAARSTRARAEGRRLADAIRLFAATGADWRLSQPT